MGAPRGDARVRAEIPAAVERECFLVVCEADRASSSLRTTLQRTNGRVDLAELPLSDHVRRDQRPLELLLKIVATMIAPCSVNASGALRRPPQLDVAECDLKSPNS